MSASDDLVPLDHWTLLQRDWIQHAVDLALTMLADGYVKQTEVILKALSNRLAVDQATEEFWAKHEQLEGGECYGLHQ